jgi:alginate O-acetyltransferase complex protein AlgI
MLFNSPQFICFFILVTALYFALPNKFLWILLLSASCYFYMAFVPIYILILGFTIIIDYFAGIAIETAQGKRRKLFLIFSLIANIGVLAVFKYYNFINTNFSFLLHNMGMKDPFPFLAILLPIGLSFHTFQAMSYTIEVYRGNQKAERHFGIYALYVMFYPQLVAGPIERPQNLLHQFRENHPFDYDRVTSGLRLMVWGFFKKIVIADRFGMLVDKVYSNPHQFNGVSLTLATFFFAYEIYCDFSGYTDIAIGAARIMGFTLMKNFKNPYQSKSISEFWTRWHISLSTWFRDYLYIPLGGNRVKVQRLYFNLMVVFLISGLWHGANWTFVIWGALHGFYLVFSLLTGKARTSLFSYLPQSVTAIVSVILTFSFVSFAWIFFRANNVSDAGYIATHVFSGWTNLNNLKNIEVIGKVKYSLLPWMGLIFLVETVNYIKEKYNITELFLRQPVYIRWAEYFVTVFIVFFCAISFVPRQFIYFQF